MSFGLIRLVDSFDEGGYEALTAALVSSVAF
jgi:hypothetical protein